jgi:hypothetical protein
MATTSGWASLGSAIAGNPTRQAALYEQGATGTARLEGLLSEARRRRDEEAGYAGITPEAITAAQSDPTQAPALVSAMFHAGLNPTQLSGYNSQALGTTIQQDAYDRARGGASVADVNPLLAVLNGKPVEVSNVKDGVSFNPYATPDQNSFNPTQVGIADIMRNGAEADAAKARAVSSYASAAKTRAGIPSNLPAGAPPPPKRAPVGYQYKADGTLQPIPGGPADKGQNAGRPPNNEQSNAAGFAMRMTEAAKQLDDLESSGYNPVNGRDRAGAGVGGAAGNFIMTDNGQRYNQAAMNFVRANLRKESGAAIGKDEAAKEYENYFPVAGDSPQVIKQKSDFRKTLTQNMIRTAGPAWRGASADAPASGGSGAPSGSIQAGHEEGGYRFRGGDAGDPANWEKI